MLALSSRLQSIHKSKKRLFFIVFMLTAVSFLSAQNINSLEGKVTDDKKQALEFVNVILKSVDSDILLGSCSDSTGHFSIKNIPSGTYEYRASSIGFSVFEDKITIDSDKSLGVIVLNPNEKLLDEITVIHRLPIIEQKTDRYILNIENSIASSGYSVSELLPMSPGVWITPDGTISINGISGTCVMINDKLIHLSGKNLLNHLRTIRSEDIKSIEIISEPSAEFDAEGLGGIINIKLKKKSTQGWSGYVGNTLTKQNFEGIYPYAGINYRRNNLTIQLSGSGDLSKWLLLRDRELFISTNDSKQLSEIKDTIKDKSFHYSAGIYYELKKKHSMGIEIRGGPWGKDENLNGVTQYFENGNLTHLLQTNLLQNQSLNKISVGLNYSWKIDTLGKELKIIADYKNQYKHSNDIDYQYLTIDSNSNLQSKENQKSRNRHPLTLFSTKLDYILPINGDVTLQTGIKYSNVDITDDMNFEELLKNSWFQIQDRSYYFNYGEHLTSGYFQGTKKWNNSSLKIGFRSENTRYQTNDSKTKNYWNFFPSAFIKHSFGEDLHHSLSVSYTKRIQRTSYYLLLPNAYYYDKFSKLEGNPDLIPEIIHTFKLSYGYKKHLFSLKYNINNKKLSKIIRIDEDKVVTQTYTNEPKEHSFRGNIYSPISICKWWKVINQFDFSYIYTNTPGKIYRDYDFDLYTLNNFLFPNNLQFELTYKYYSPSRSGYTRSESYHLLNIAIKKGVLKNKGNIKFSSPRILCNQKYVTHTDGVTTFRTSKSYYNTPLFKLSFTYNFSIGNKVIRKRLEQSNQEEMQRTY